MYCLFIYLIVTSILLISTLSLLFDICSFAPFLIFYSWGFRLNYYYELYFFFSKMLRLRAMNLPLTTGHIVTHKFRMLCSFLFYQNFFFHFNLGSFYIQYCLSVSMCFFCCWYPALILGGQVRYRVLFQLSPICWDLFCVQVYYSIFLSWNF